MGCVSSTNDHPATDSTKLKVTNRGTGGTDGVVFNFESARRNIEAKVVLLGDSGCGKSSLAVRFCQGRFSPYHEVTIGAAFLQQVVRLRDGTRIKLHIWDTGGQERFRAMAPLYYRDAAGAAIVYDVSHMASFESVRYWVKELRSRGPPHCCITIASNKNDIPDKEVNPEIAMEYCAAEGIPFIECSAKTGDNVGMLFEGLANFISEKQKDFPQDDYT